MSENIKNEKLENESEIEKKIETEIEELEAIEESEVNQETANLEDQLRKEIEQLKNDYTRKLAEFQNFTRRKENEFSELKKYASEKIIVKLLDNIDNLERAISSSKDTKNFDALMDGVNMILNNMKYLLQEEEVEEINVEEGVSYNPYEQQAVMTDSNADLENDVVTKVLQKGYKLKGKIIRPAMVSVNKK